MDHPALFTDLYQLTMAQAYLQSGTTGSATFSLYFRSYPPDRAYFVLGGVDDALDYLESLRFTGDDLDYLESLDLFDGGFLDCLAGLRFTGSVRAMREGSVFFAGEPVLEVTAPIIEAQIVETCLLNQVNLQTILATKASRVVHAARGRTVVDFAARRTQGDGGVEQAGPGRLRGGLRGHQQRTGWEDVRHPRLWHDGPLVHRGVRVRGGGPARLRSLLSR